MYITECRSTLRPLFLSLFLSLPPFAIAAMNTRFTFAELLTSPIPQHHNTHDQEKLDYYYYSPYQQHPHPTQWSAMSNFYTQSAVAPPTPQPQPIQLMPSSSSPPSPPQQPQQQQQRTRGRRVSNVPNQGLRMFACKSEGCGKVFKRSEHLKRHVRSIHTMEKRKYCAPDSNYRRLTACNSLQMSIPELQQAILSVRQLESTHPHPQTLKIIVCVRCFASLHIQFLVYDDHKQLFFIAISFSI